MGRHVGWWDITPLGNQFWRFGIQERSFGWCCDGWAWDSFSVSSPSGWGWVK